MKTISSLRHIGEQCQHELQVSISKGSCSQGLSAASVASAFCSTGRTRAIRLQTSDVGLKLARIRLRTRDATLIGHHEVGPHAARPVIEARRTHPQIQGSQHISTVFKLPSHIKWRAHLRAPSHCHRSQESCRHVGLNSPRLLRLLIRRRSPADPPPSPNRALPHSPAWVAARRTAPAVEGGAAQWWRLLGEEVGRAGGSHSPGRGERQAQGEDA